jgi:hypothetical protein
MLYIYIERKIQPLKSCGILIWDSGQSKKFQSQIMITQSLKPFKFQQETLKNEALTALRQK